jgi:hypothetical protein
VGCTCGQGQEEMGLTSHKSPQSLSLLHMPGCVCSTMRGSGARAGKVRKLDMAHICIRVGKLLGATSPIRVGPTHPISFFTYCIGPLLDIA